MTPTNYCTKSLKDVCPNNGFDYSLNAESHGNGGTFFLPDPFCRYLTSQGVLPVFLALMKAIPCVLKCVFRSDALSNRL